MKLKVINQNAIDIIKISDLKEAVGTIGDKTVWIIDGEEFSYTKGDNVIKGKTSQNGDIEYWPIDQANKTAAKRKLFDIIKS